MQPETQKLLEVMAGIGAEIANRDCGQRIYARALDALAALNGIVHEEPPSLDIGPSMEAIIEGVTGILHVDPKLVLSACRSQRVAAARQICFWFCRKLTGRSFPEIGKVFNRDHSTIIHGVRLIERRSLSPKYARTLLAIERSLGPKSEVAVAA